jgi:hypothetical protein
MPLHWLETHLNAMGSEELEMARQILSKQTKKNWWTDALLLCSAMVAALSGIYFLYLPSGYQGGRNPFYNVTVIFSRNTWGDLHTWGGIAMIAIAVIHITIHWQWVVSMAKRTWNEMTGKCGCMNPRGRWNLILNATVALSFIITAISGVYFLFFPDARWANDPLILFDHATWDIVHTWSGILLIIGAIIHLAIHWRWATNVTTKMIKGLFPPRSATQPAVITNT